MKLEPMRFPDNITKSKQVNFGGLNHRIGARDGELWDMQNLTAEHYPTLSTRCRRQITWDNIQKPHGVFFWDTLYWAAGTGFYREGQFAGVLTDTRKIFAGIGPYVIIFPDKKAYNTETGEMKNLEAQVSATDVSFRNGTIYGEPADANTIYHAGTNWADFFKPGDAVTISGCTTQPKNNQTIIIREIDGDEMHFYENSFTITGEGYAETGQVSIARKLPDLEAVFECDNRLWGFRDRTIYASKLGDPFNWNVYDGLSTDAWAVEIGGTSALTAGIAYNGYPMFFTMNAIYKVFGKYPSAYQTSKTDGHGVIPAARWSLAIAGNVLFYLSSAGICAYSGGTPSLISAPFGDQQFSAAVAGSDGDRYFVSMTDYKKRTARLYVYDTRYNAWHIEDDTDMIDAARYGGNLLLMTTDGVMFIVKDNEDLPYYTVKEDAFDWYAEFDDFYGYTTYKGSGTPLPQHKGITKLQLRLELEKDATAELAIRYDSSGEWITVATLDGTVKQNHYLGIIPHRCDHFRLRMQGHGGMRLYSLAYDYYEGSDLNTH